MQGTHGGEQANHQVETSAWDRFRGWFDLLWVRSKPELRRGLQSQATWFASATSLDASVEPSTSSKLARVLSGADHLLHEGSWERARLQVATRRLGVRLVGACAAIALLLLAMRGRNFVFAPLLIGGAAGALGLVARSRQRAFRMAFLDPVRELLASPPIGEAEARRICRARVAPFFQRHQVFPDAESPDSASQGGTRIQRMAPPGKPAPEVCIPDDELDLFRDVLREEGLGRTVDLAAMPAFLVACALRLDHDAYLARVSMTGESDPILAHVRLYGEDEAALPFLQARCGREDRDALMEAVRTRRRELLRDQLRADLEQRAIAPPIRVTLDLVDAMIPYNFELLVGLLYESDGYAFTPTAKGNDQGSDGFALRAGEKTVIQCKLYGQPVGNKAVQEAVAARVHFRCQHAVVVTNQTFTPSARELASSTCVELVDRERLRAWLDAFDKKPKDQDRLAELLVPRGETGSADDLGDEE